MQKKYITKTIVSITLVVTVRFKDASNLAMNFPPENIIIS